MITSNEDCFKQIYDLEYKNSNAFKRITIWKSLLGHYIMDLKCKFRYDKSFGHRVTAFRLDLECNEFTTYIEYPNILDTTKNYDIFVKRIENDDIRVAFLKM